jgi:hypothetical protein
MQNGQRCANTLAVAQVMRHPGDHMVTRTPEGDNTGQVFLILGES